MAFTAFFECSVKSSASRVQYSSGINSSICASLSHIIRRATDCTLPADNPLFTFAQSRGLIEYPTIRSNTLLACCASTRFISRFLGCLIASFIAFFVISLKLIRNTFFSLSSSFKAFDRCQLIASPSRSGSVARYILSAFLTSFFSLASNSPLPLMVIYFGSKSFSTSIPIVDLGKSRTCPFDAVTSYPEPKYFFMVFTFAGDSTITKLPAILTPY